MTPTTDTQLSISGRLPPAAPRYRPLADDLRAAVDTFIAAWRVEGAVDAQPVRREVRLDDRSSVRAMIRDASPRQARLRHTPARLRELATWAEAQLDAELVGLHEREGFVLLHQESGEVWRRPGTHVILRREVDGWRLVRVDRVWVRPEHHEYLALVSPAEVLTREAATGLVELPTTVWVPKTRDRILVVTGRNKRPLSGPCWIPQAVYARRSVRPGFMIRPRFGPASTYLSWLSGRCRRAPAVEGRNRTVAS